MPFKNVNCDVESPGDPYGDFANSFRITQDGRDILLDFCVYSARENKARVVSRVRVSIEFLPIIHQKIGNSLRIKLDEASPLFIMPVQGSS